MATQLYNKTTGVAIYPIIDSSSIPTMAITAIKIASGAIQSTHISAGAVTTSAIYTDAVTTDKIADNAVTTAKIADDSIDASKIADHAVKTEHIQDGVITSAKMEDGSITTAKINNGAITTPKIDDGAITSLKISNESIDSSHINFRRYTATDLLTTYATTLADMLVLLSEIRQKVHWFYGVYSGDMMGVIPYMVEGSTALYVQSWDTGTSAMIWVKLDNDTDYQNWLNTSRAYLQFIS